MDTGAWCATVHRVRKSWIQLKQLSMHVCRKVVITLDISHTFLVKVISGNNQLSTNQFLP